MIWNLLPTAKSAQTVTHFQNKIGGETSSSNACIVQIIMPNTCAKSRTLNVIKSIVVIIVIFFRVIKKVGAALLLLLVLLRSLLVNSMYKKVET
jgi:hypothetical protein